MKLGNKIIVFGIISGISSWLLHLGFKSKEIDVVSIGDYDGDGKQEIVGVERFRDKGISGERLVFYDEHDYKRVGKSFYSNGKGNALNIEFCDSCLQNRYWKVISYSKEYKRRGNTNLYIDIE